MSTVKGQSTHAHPDAEAAQARDDIPEHPVPPEVLAHAHEMVAKAPLPLHVQADIAQHVAQSIREALQSQPGLGLHEALLQGFCQHLGRRLEADVMEHHKGVMKTLDAICQTVKTWIECTAQHNEHALYSLGTVLSLLQEHGIQVRSDPYRASVEARSPQGFVIHLDVAKQNAEDFIEALPKLLDWLRQEGYGAV